MTAQTRFVGSIDIMIYGTFGRTLLILDVAVTLLANLTVKTITCTFFALNMTRSTQGLSFQVEIFEVIGSGLARNPVQVEAFGAVFRGLQTLIDEVGVLRVEDGPFARIATIGSDGVFGAFAASNAIFVARFALAVVVILAVGTLLDAERAVFGVFAGMARIGSGAVASQFALRMAFLAFFFRSLKKAKIRVT